MLTSRALLLLPAAGLRGLLMAFGAEAAPTAVGVEEPNRFVTAPQADNEALLPLAAFPDAADLSCWLLLRPELLPKGRRLPNSCRAAEGTPPEAALPCVATPPPPPAAANTPSAAALPAVPFCAADVFMLGGAGQALLLFEAGAAGSCDADAPLPLLLPVGCHAGRCCCCCCWASPACCCCCCRRCSLLLCTASASSSGSWLR